MFEQVEAHVERMFGLITEIERKRNPVIAKFEKRMRRVLLQMKMLAKEKQARAQIAKGRSECSK